MGQNPGLSSGNAERIRVLVVDTTRVRGQLLAESLAQERRFAVTWSDPKVSSIMDSMAQEKPHVLLLSLRLEDGARGALDAIRRARSAHPESRIVILANTPGASTVVEAFRAGVQGILSRGESLSTVARCIACVHQGQVWANSQELRHVLDALRASQPARALNSQADNVLSKREQDVVRCVAEGLSNRGIASRLKLTEHTVKNYLFRIFDKLGVSSRVEVVLYVFRMRKETATLADDSVGNAHPELLRARRNSSERIAPTPVEGVRELRRRSRMQRS